MDSGSLNKCYLIESISALQKSDNDNVILVVIINAVAVTMTQKVGNNDHNHCDFTVRLLFPLFTQASHLIRTQSPVRTVVIYQVLAKC